MRKGHLRVRRGPGGWCARNCCRSAGAGRDTWSIDVPWRVVNGPLSRPGARDPSGANASPIHDISMKIASRPRLSHHRLDRDRRRGARSAAPPKVRPSSSCRAPPTMREPRGRIGGRWARAGWATADLADEDQADARRGGRRSPAFGRIDGLFAVAGGSGRRFGDGPIHELTARRLGQDARRSTCGARRSTCRRGRSPDARPRSRTTRGRAARSC